MTGVMQWPIVAAVGGTALVLDQLKPGTPKPDKSGSGEKAVPAVPAGSAAEAAAPVPVAKAAPRRRASTKPPSS
ncbi:hypothetical protein ACFWAY_24790 [Rhodococcus sp. NPDC059968]|uniref:hypothetical protein n=1 Tax=Rhodococcus sp. NPDC059968 TaxID=3347017 RepID=UPI00366A9631